MTRPVFKMWQGGTVRLRIALSQSPAEDAPPVDLTGASALFLMKECIGDPNEEALITKTHLNGIAIDDPANGRALLTIEGEDTINFNISGYELYPSQVMIRLSNGEEVPSAVFNAKIYESVIKGGEVAPGPPVVTTQPQSQTVTQGDSVTFYLVASGLAPLAYQWRKNGLAISGATSPTLTLAAVQTTDAGTYDCVVTNTYGSSISIGAQLTVSVVTLAIYLGNAGANQPPSYSEAEIKAWYNFLPGVTPVHKSAAAGTYQISPTSIPGSNEFRCFAFPASFIVAPLQFTSAGATLPMDSLGNITVNGISYALYRTSVRSSGGFTLDGNNAIVVT